jgi:hypothetical protein
VQIRGNVCVFARLLKFYLETSHFGSKKFCWLGERKPPDKARAWRENRTKAATHIWDVGWKTLTGEPKSRDEVLEAQAADIAAKRMQEETWRLFTVVPFTANALPNVRKGFSFGEGHNHRNEWL